MPDCSLYDSHMGATYSLIDLKKHSAQLPYVIHGGNVPCTQQVGQNYTYYFNICGTINSGIPKVCSDDPTLVSSLPTATALQVNDQQPDPSAGINGCHIIGSFSSETSGISLMDQEDPTKGLKLTYFGKPCGTSETIKRQVNIELSCADILNPMPQSAYELSTCVYTIAMPSVYGCPLECPVSKRSLCGGAGYCAYDYDAQKARCFCNKGSGGSDCSLNIDNNDIITAGNGSPVILALIITVVLVICALVSSVLYMIKQVRAYQDDSTHYQVLKGGGGGGDETKDSRSFNGRNVQMNV